MSIGWAVAANKAQGSLDDRIRDLAFRREVLATVRDELGASAVPTARELRRLLDGEAFIALAIDPENHVLRQQVDDGGSVDALVALDGDSRARLLSTLTGAVAVTALRRADPAIRLLNAKLDDVTDIVLNLLYAQLDLGDAVERVVDRRQPGEGESQ